jgi:methionyl-tRNA formyltransferase
MRIAVFGLPNQIIHTLDALRDAEHSISVVIPPTPTHQAHQLVIKYAQSKNIPCIFFQQSPLEPDFLKTFSTFAPDVAFVCGFDKLIPPELLKIPRLGFINFHPSYLPDYRGGNAYFYTIAEGEKTAGATAHFIDEHFDTGDIIYQEKINLDTHETMGTLANKAERTLAQLAVRIANELREGKILPRKPQPTGEFKEATSIIPDRGDTIIHWDKPAVMIERFVRACNPFYDAITRFRGKMFIILQGSAVPGITAKATPGTIVKCTGTELLILTAQGCFAPTVIQYDNYVIGTIDRFIEIVQPQVGELLS